MTTYYKFLHLTENGTLHSAHGGTTWTPGQWQTLPEGVHPLCCQVGFHCSQRPIDALSYTHGEILATVEVAGESDTQSDKEAWQSMCLTAAWHWTIQDSIALAIEAASLVLPLYKESYPEDTRPQHAIEMAQAYLENPTAAYTAAAAYATAAYAAAAAAYAAAYAAAAYAAAAADGDILARLSAWMIERIPHLTPYV